MTYLINILEEAEHDIEDIYYYVAYNDSKANAESLIDQLETACFSYRIIHQIESQQVYIYAVLDGRRDMTTLLETRVLRVQRH